MWRRLFFCPNCNATIELDDMDITSAETKATYDEIKKYVAEHNAGMKVSNLYIRCEMTPTSLGGEEQISISGGSQSPI